MTARVTVLDHGMGNLRSVAKALESVGASVEIASEVPDKGVDLLVVPGQGHFGACVRTLGEVRMSQVRDWIEAQRPYLGICLGLQVLFDGSQEDPAAGMGVVDGSVVRFGPGPKVPHIGWNSIQPADAGREWFEGLEDELFYFVHSYFPEPRDDQVIAARTDHGGTFCSAVARGPMLATQFHPEKSGRVGLELLKRVVAGSRAA
ncbi:MAG: imidazole glycerol phosphate synthase subunit HisH [Actinomycetota bacterium]